MNIAVVDDFESDRQKLVDFVNKYDSENDIGAHISTFASGEELIEKLQITPFDIIFLDNYMGGLNGIETAKQIRTVNKDCKLIFISTTQSYAVESYRVRAFDYLLKPYGYDQFEKVIELVCQARNKTSANVIQIKQGKIQTKILLSDIIYCDYQNHYIRIHTLDSVIKTYMSFTHFSEQILKYHRFLYCSRNIIINMDKVEEIQKESFLMKNNVYIPIRRSMKNEIKQKYADYAFQKVLMGDAL